MNLLDIIPVEKVTPRYTRTKVKEAATMLADIGELRRLRELPQVSTDEKTAIGQLITRLNGQLTTKRRAFAMESGSLPDSLHADDALTKFATSPRMKLAEARELADRFGFVIIPFDYSAHCRLQVKAIELDPKYNESFSDCKMCSSKSTHDNSCMSVIKAATKKAVVEATIPLEAPLRGTVQSFIAEAQAQNHRVYLICPITYYSLTHHVASTNDYPIYAGVHSQAFMGINISIPMFRQLSRKITEIEARQTASEIRLDMVETELQNLARRIEEIERAEEQRQRELALARLAAERAAAETARIRAVERFIPYDPLAIAIPTTTDVSGDALCVVGPCWGPDFDAVVAEARGYKRVKGQRKLLSARWA
jgi:hypothetical protein